MRVNPLVRRGTLVVVALSIANFTIIFYLMSSYSKTTISDVVIWRPDEIYCMDILNEMTRGHWQPKKNITTSDLVKSEKLHLLIRKRKQFPLKLMRNDSRCGSKFPLPPSGIVYRTPSQCNASSIKPCCNDITGQCGNTTSHCNCPRCVDFRTILSAELCYWETSSGCIMKNFTSVEACQLMNNRVSNLILIGDSLMRHFHNALMILFRNDPHRGALRKNLTDKQYEACSGDLQFVDGGKTICHERTAFQIKDINKSSFCGGNFRFHYPFNASISTTFAKGALAAVESLLNKENSIVLIGVGLHDNLNFQRLKQHYIEPILMLVEKNARSGWPKIVWVTIHSHGFLKPTEFLKSQGNDRILAFNRRMKAYLEPRGVNVFDVFNLTSGIRSHDGTHYGASVNMMKAQLFLNYLMKL